jgi:H+/gluconate symporter-like permease
MHTVIVIGFVVLGVGAAIIAALREATESRAERPEPADETAQYAPTYTPRERVQFTAIALGVCLPLGIAAEVWGFPALRSFAETSYCHEWFGVNGTTVLMYGVFVGIPLGTGLLVGVPFALFGVRVIRDRQFPPSGQKVSRPTRIRRGQKATVTGWACQLPLLFFIGLGV